MEYDYKCVAAPERAKRRKGARGRTERVAAAMEEILRAEGVDGWEYMRTDLVPVEERAGWLSRVQEVHRAVMVFRRARAAARRGGAPSLQDTVPEPVFQIAGGQNSPDNAPGRSRV